MTPTTEGVWVPPGYEAAAITFGLSLFVDRLQGALVQESSNFLAADRQISSSQAIPDDFFLRAQSKGLETAQT